MKYILTENYKRFFKEALIHANKLKEASNKNFIFI